MTRIVHMSRHDVHGILPTAILDIPQEEMTDLLECMQRDVKQSLNFTYV